ncbi:hypothetical protein QWY84_16490 [Aquisalimonas lutea]|nr:hypothetical protein [Aquisalimonas lutea]MDN3519214.1 hypothetical protein [Aquisalimonas lutea]
MDQPVSTLLEQRPGDVHTVGITATVAELMEYIYGGYGPQAQVDA